MSRNPTVAATATVRLTRAVVGLKTVTLLIVTPAPRLTVVIPATKWVLKPVITTSVVSP
jgi:hypothetical protein